ncbi:MAG: HAMP domain-containing protein [Verrucomicrobia bacterium]|nr:HAMP domain-containing protein [Verrucomicrobiota bacterium]
MSIRTRLTIWLGGILLVSLVVLSAVLHHEFVEVQERAQKKHEENEPAWQESAEIVLFYGLPAVLMLLMGSWVLLRKSLAPVTSLTRAAESINANNLKARLPQSGNGDELDRLTEVFNSMMTRLDESFTHIREFTLNASHELKTPLTIMRAEIETALRDPATPHPQREIFADQLDEIARLTKIVDALTLLAKADAGQITLAKAPVRFDDIVRDSFVDAQLLARPTRLKVELKACEQTTIQGDRHRLKQLLLNLADNAIKYNHPEGEVTFALTQDNGDAELTIANTGPGIAPEKLPRVFDRFYRGDLAHNSAVEGCGLGLSIAQWIVKAHGGSIRVTSEPQKLTTVRVKLPITDTV